MIDIVRCVLKRRETLKGGVTSEFAITGGVEVGVGAKVRITGILIVRQR